MGVALAVLPRRCRSRSTASIWLHPRASVAHPLDDGRAVMLYRSLERDGGAGSARDATRYRPARGAVPRAIRTSCSPTLLARCACPRIRSLLLRFGLRGAASRRTGSRGCAFRDERARALFAGCAAHSILPLDAAAHRRARRSCSRSPAHVEDWPVPQGGSQAISARSLRYLRTLGGEIETGRRIERLAELAAPRASCCSTLTPRPARAHRGRRAAGGLPPPARALPLRARRLQARLGARRADPVARPRLPRGVDGARRRHARGDRRRRARHVATAATPSARS